MPEVLLINSLSEAQAELKKIGCDPRGIRIMKDKALFYAVKVKGLTPPQANIIKQEMLSYGGEAASAYGTINQSIKKTDMLIFGTIAQFKELTKKLSAHPFSLPQIGRGIERTLSNFGATPPPLELGNKRMDFRKKTFIMGIVNVTPDSFSDGGQYFETGSAIERVKELIDDGADIIDIGGESTRPGSKAITEKEELRRVIPVIKAAAKMKKCVISIDTQKSRVADQALKAGAHIVNDISALRHDKKMAKVIAKHKAGVILMHMLGTPKTMQKKPRYSDVVSEVSDFLKERIEFAKKAGILSGRIMIDPGFGFGKELHHNLELLRRLSEFKALGRPIVAGTSRKAMIGKILDLPSEKRIMGTAATISVAILNGANIIRVHDVSQMRETSKMIDAIARRRQ